MQIWKYFAFFTCGPQYLSLAALLTAAGPWVRGQIYDEGKHAKREIRSQR